MAISTDATFSYDSRYAIGLTLLACMVGWGLIPYSPDVLPSSTQQGLFAILMRIFTWWPLALPVAYALALWIGRQPIYGRLRKALVTLEELLTFASLALVIVSLSLVLLSLPG